jgi:hypothetical protein
MPDYLFLMHDDAPDGADEEWDAYLARLRATGRFQGGSAIGDGVCVRRSGPIPAIAGNITGFIRISAENLADARAMLAGNPVYEAGGTVEIRELPQTG